MDTVAFTFCHLSKESVRPSLPSYPDELKTIGDHIRHQRLDLGLYQKEVAELIGVTTDTVTNWELNRVKPEIHYIPLIIDFLGYLPFTVGETFPEQLRATRKILGLTQRQLAWKAGIDPSTLGDWETGRCTPNKNKRKLIESYIKDVMSYNNIIL